MASTWDMFVTNVIKYLICLVTIAVLMSMSSDLDVRSLVLKKSRLKFPNDSEHIYHKQIGRRNDRVRSFARISYDNITFALLKWSILISLAQTGFLIILLMQYGSDPMKSNPYFGPSIDILIQFGAKDADLIIENEEYWRLLSAIMLHAGVYHLIGNIALQILISGHLEHTWGVIIYFAIYFSCGVVGYMFSCCFLYNAVSVGSSGSIMGLLASWFFDLAFSLQKARAVGDSERVGGQRESVMLYSILAAVLITLASSWSSGVDWASHAGGCLYGMIWACFLFPKKSSKNESSIVLLSASPIASDFENKRIIIRIISASLLLLIPALLLLHMITS